MLDTTESDQGNLVAIINGHDIRRTTTMDGDFHQVLGASFQSLEAAIAYAHSRKPAVRMVETADGPLFVTAGCDTVGFRTAEAASEAARCLDTPAPERWTKMGFGSLRRA